VKDPAFGCYAMLLSGAVDRLNIAFNKKDNYNILQEYWYAKKLFYMYPGYKQNTEKLSYVNEIHNEKCKQHLEILNEMFRFIEKIK